MNRIPLTNHYYFFFLVIGFWMNYVYHLVITGFFSIVDVTQKPHFIYKYKVQPGTNEELSWKKIFQVSILLGFILIFGSK